MDATLREFAAGQKLFDRYTLIKTLGRGGMGVVWLARDDELERNVALKFLPDLIIHDRAVLGDLRRETRRSLELTHKNIVRIYDFVHNNQSGCISMEYVDGDTLSNLRADKSQKIFETSELTDWAAQLCDALDYAHNHARIIHRDLKPANLMVNQRGDLKIADFGIARSLSDSMSALTMDRGKSGTLVYMSPQQLDGERGTHLDDIYSFGASVYELLTSKPPFSSGNVDRQIHEKVPLTMTQRRRELEIKGEPIEETWERVVASCLAKDPARRPQSVAHIADHLDLVAPKTKTRRSSAIPKPRRTIKAIPIGIGAALLCLLGAGLWYFSLSPQKRPAEMNTVVPAPARSETAAPPAAIPLGGVIVNSSPDGATVTLGGTSAGKSPVTFKELRPGKYQMRIALNGYETIDKEVEVKGNEFTDLGTITLQPSKSGLDLTTVPAGAKVFQGETLLGVTPLRRTDLLGGDATLILLREGYLPREVKATLSPAQNFKSDLTLTKAAPVYAGTISIRNETGVATPLTIKLDPNLTSGTMQQTGKRGDVVLKFNGVWEGATLRAVTNEIVSKPPGTNWQPESFSLRFAEDGMGASYECNSGGKTYVAQLGAQFVPAASRAGVYKGTIRSTDDKNGAVTPLTIKLEADHKSGTMTQTSKSGDTVVKFNGVLEGKVLHAVTDEVVSKPAKVQWDPESFTLRFTDDWSSGSYECKAGGKTYLASLMP